MIVSLQELNDTFCIVTLGLAFSVVANSAT
jgi:hypothetical protein